MKNSYHAHLPYEPVSTDFRETHGALCFVLSLFNVYTKLSTFILQSQMEFEAQVFKDPHDFHDI